jgi:FAD/FMN-containing dehydrogenase
MAYALAADAEEGTALRQELPPWVLVVGLGGRALLADERVAVQERDLSDATQQAGMRPLTVLHGVATSKIQGMLQGYVSVPPDGERYWKLLPKGDSRDVFFLTTLDRAPGFVDTMRALCARLRYPEADVGVYIQPQHQGTACHCEFTLPFTPDDEREVARTQTLFAEAGRDLAAQGAYFSRPYGLWAALAYGRDAQSTAVLRLVKGVLDPNNVLNPGKLCF